MYWEEKLENHKKFGCLPIFQRLIKNIIFLILVISSLTGTINLDPVETV